jgi:hypothetical protein
MIVDSLLTLLGYEYDGEGLEAFEEATDRALEITTKFSAAVFGAAAALTGMAVASAQSTDEAAKQARTLGVAIEDYQALQFAAEQTTGSSNQLYGSLERFVIGIGEATRGTGTAVEALGILGINLTDSGGKLKSTTDLLNESADALNNVGDQGLRLELADKLGIKDLDLLLRGGSKGIRELTREASSLGLATAADAKAAEEFNDQWNRILKIGAAISREVSTHLLPVLTEMSEKFQDFMQNNRELVSGTLTAFFKNLLIVMKGLLFVFAGIAALKVGLAIMTIVTALKALSMAALIAQAKMLAIPILITVAVAALALAIEDIWTAFQGGDSFLGDFSTWLRDFEWFDKLIISIVDNVEKLVGVFNSLSEVLPESLDIATSISRAIVPDFVTNSLSDLLSSTFGPGASGAGSTVSNSTVGDVNININGGDTVEVEAAVNKALASHGRQAAQELSSVRNR